IQQNFFSNPQQVAWVYDPHTDEEGCFGWIGDKIEKLTAIRVGYLQNIDPSTSVAGPNDYEDEDAALDSMVRVGPHRATEEPPWMRWISLALGYLAAAILGVAGGFFLQEWKMGPAVENMKLISQCREIRWQSQVCQEALLELTPGFLTRVPATPAPQTQ